MGIPKILIVEDEHIVAESLNSTLATLGYEVTGMADSADEALQLGERSRPDLALMDIALRGPGDGVSAAAEFRRRWQIPVVFLTAYCDEELLARATESGAFGYLNKPFRTNELNAAIILALERNRASLELQRQRTWLTTLLASISDGVVSIDIDGRVTFINPQAEALTGWKQAEAVGQPIEQVYSLSTTDGRTVRELRMRAVLDGRQETRPERFLVQSRSGTKVLIEEAVSPVTDNHEVIGAIASFRDLRERVRAQHYETLAVLAGGFAHDFNNLLTSILGNTSLALQQIASSTPPTKAFLEEAVNASHRAADLTRHLLAYAGKGQFAARRLEISRVVAELRGVLQQSIPPGVRLEMALSPGLPEFKGDAAQIDQMILNLVTNAGEAMQHKEGTISVLTGFEHLQRGQLDELGSHGAAPGRFVYVEVADGGVGMDEVTLARIFEPFFTTKFVGRGMGLAVVYGIVRQHKGAIRVSTKPGVGTTFRVFLPALPAG